jgi:diguanylate cyclase (GGDEF)-like protein
VQRFRAALLALGLVALLAGLAAGVLASRSATNLDHDLGLAGASRVTALDDYAERARAVTLLASHSAAFANFYQASGSREQRIEGRTGGAELMPRVDTALMDLETLFPDSVASASFIDRSGAENARVVGSNVIPPDELVQNRRNALFFRRAFELPYDKVYQSAPYRSASTGDWVVANAAKVNIGPGVSPAIVSFEVTLESFRLAFYSENPDYRIRVVDVDNGSVVIDSTHPQDVGAALGEPHDRSLAWAARSADGQMRTVGSERYVVRRVARDGHVATRWVVVVSTARPVGAWSGPFAVGPLALAATGVLMLLLSCLGYMAQGRSMHRAARRDELTGLHNRLAAREGAETLLAHERALAVILFDLDRFKHVNDSLGHHAGDQLLVVIAQRLAEVVREPEDVVARLGGDEFVVIARGVHDEDAVAVLCERLTRAIVAPVMVDGVEVSVGASIGIALAPEHGSDYGTLLQRADIAMYDAKGRRAGWQIYRDEFAVSDRAGLLMDADLRRAVTDGELVVHFQPSYEVGGGAMTRAEALVRWHHPKRGMLMPGHFVPFAETNGSIKAVTRVVLGLVLDQVVAWHTQGLDVPVAVNVSAHDINDAGFADLVAGMLAARDLPPSALVIELTETALLADTGVASGTLWALSRLGVRIAVDDFGAGYASLLYLRQFPVSVLKLDRSLVQGLVRDPTDAALVRWTIEMAHALKVTCVAEGVEDAQTLSALLALGCDEAQGFFLQAPVPAEQLEVAMLGNLTEVVASS